MSRTTTPTNIREDANWTRGVVVDCIFRTAGSEAKIGKRADAVKW